MPISHTVDRPGALLAFLLASHPDVKRTRVQQWLKHRSVHVNGHAVTRATHLLEPGDIVSILAKGEIREDPLLPGGLRLVFEDASLIVIDKPENLLSVANAKERTETAYAFLTEYVRRGGAGRSARVWIVHRLDRETSGLMVFAKTTVAKRALQARWDQTEKRYLAVVEGCPPADNGVLRSHLNEGSPFKVYSAPSTGETRPAVTRLATCALVELTPETGRRHELRVQLADAECPIIGDDKYKAQTNPAGRLGLHATALAFEHPVSGARLQFESPLPQALSRLVDGSLA